VSHALRATVSDSVYRVIAESVDANAAISSLMSKPKLMKMKMRMTTTRTSSMKSRTISLPTHIPMILQIFQQVERLMTGGTESWTDGVRWKQASMPKSRQKFYGNDMPTRTDLAEPLGTLLWYQSVYYFQVSMIRVFGQSDVRKARKERLCSQS